MASDICCRTLAMYTIYYMNPITITLPIYDAESKIKEQKLCLVEYPNWILIFLSGNHNKWVLVSII